VERLEDRTVAAVHNFGGALLRHVGVEAVFLGSAWQSDPALAALPGQLGGFLQTITGSTYLGSLTRAGYHVGRGSYLGAATDPLALGDTLNDSEIQNDLAAAITSGSVLPPDANRLYVVFVEPGAAVTSPFGDSRFGLLGYHSDFLGPTGTGVSYAVIPFPSDPSEVAPGLSVLDALTTVTSHELAEAVTDPQGVNVGRPAWVDLGFRDPVTGQQGAEIADQTEGVLLDLNGYVVQAVVNRQEHVLIPGGATLDARSFGVPAGVRALFRHRAHAAAQRADEAVRPDQAGYGVLSTEY
jgi:hypothetical protein